MKRLFLTVACLLMLTTLSASPALANYPDPNRQTMWNNITDSMHTLGQNPAQARKTKQRLHNARRRARINSINQATFKNWQQNQQGY